MHASASVVLSGRMKTFKTIYRLDFPPSLGLLDHLGELGESLKTNMEDRGVPSPAINVDLISHTISSKVRHGDELTAVTLAPTNLNSVVEHGARGIEVAAFHEAFAVGVAESLVRVLEANGVAQFSRLGLRMYVVVRDPLFTFDRVRETLGDAMSHYTAGMREQFPDGQDLAFTFEGRSDAGTRVRVNLGPYQNSQSGRYFAQPLEFGEGLMFDVDVWEERVELPRFSLPRFVRRQTSSIETITRATIRALHGRIAHAD